MVSRIDFAKAIIDNDLNIVKVSSYFNELMDSNNLTSLKNCFSIEDCKSITEACSKKNSSIICRAIVGEQKKFIIDIQEYMEGLYKLRFFDLMNITNTLAEVVNTNNLYEKILSNFKMDYFTFNPARGIIELQNMSGIKLNLTFSNFFDYLAKKSIVIEESLKFKETLLSCEEYTVFRAKNEARNIFITIAPFLNSFEEEMVVGTIIYNRLTEALLLENHEADDTDGLTGLKNKVSIQNYLDNRVDVCKNKTTLLIIDIDNFKELNDTYGHKYGDEVLVTVAKIIRRNIGPSGVAGRFGGDEFIAILNTTDSAEVREIARGIRMGIQWISAGKKDKKLVTCSIGIARYPEDVHNSIDLFKLADKCLYIAKNKGKNRYIFYTYEIHGDVLHDKEIPMEQSQSEQTINEKFFELLDQCYLGDISVEFILGKLYKTYNFSHVVLYSGPELREIYSFGENTNIKSGKYMTTDKYLELFYGRNYLCLSNTSSLLTTHKDEMEYLSSEYIKALFQFIDKDKDGNIVSAISLEVLRSPRTFKTNEINLLFLVCRLIMKKLNKKI